MVERHRGAKSKVVLIAKSSKEQVGYEGAQDRGFRRGPKTTARRPCRALAGTRHTALAAKSDLEERKSVSRGLSKNFLDRGGPRPASSRPDSLHALARARSGSRNA